MKNLINEEVKKLQKIAGLLNEDMDYGDNPMEDVNDSPESQERIDGFVRDNYPGAVKREDPGEPIYDDYIPLAYYDWKDESDTDFDPEFSVVGVAIQKTEDGVGYFEILGTGETADPYGEPHGFIR